MPISVDLRHYPEYQRRSPDRNHGLSGRDRVWAVYDYDDLTKGERAAVQEAIAAPTLMISPKDINHHTAESCFETESSWDRKSLAKSVKNGCLCCLVRLRAVKAIEQDLEGSEAKYNLRGIRCCDDGQFVSDQGSHDADGVKRFPRIYYDVFTLPNFPRLDGACTRDNPSGDTKSESALAFAQKMISSCVANHKTCRIGHRNPLPTRILDIRESQVHLCEKSGERARYAALSHCWGGKIDVQTTSQTYIAFKERISWDLLPKTFQDAILFSRSLGLQYIWIDSLCIIQDSRPDWHRESAKMKQVYQGAFITLAATASQDSFGGCFKKAEFKSRPIAKVKVGTEIVDLYARRRWRHIWTKGNSFEPLQAPYYPMLDRAWVFQERLLSTRVIHFTTNELMWECREMKACECLEMDKVTGDRDERGIKLKFNAIVSAVQVTSMDAVVLQPEKLSGHQVQSFGPWTSDSKDKKQQPLEWSDIVNDYSELSLTYHADRLPALSGIAKSLDASDRGKYFAGLWEHELPSSLCWFARQPSSRHPESSYPSWSWASISDSITAVDMREQRSVGSCVTIHEVQCSLASDDPHGEVLEGRLVLSGKLIAAKCASMTGLAERRREQVTWLKYHDMAVEFGGGKFFCLWDGYPPQVSDLFCLKMNDAFDTVYMVLCPVNWDTQTYRRVGLIKEDYGDRFYREKNTTWSGNASLNSDADTKSSLGWGIMSSWGGFYAHELDFDSPFGKYPDGSPIPEDGIGSTRRITIV